MAKLNIQPVTKSRLKEEAAKLEEKKLKGITQVKLFQVGNPDVGILEEEIFLFYPKFLKYLKKLSQLK